jgi:hypothetical protein
MKKAGLLILTLWVFAAQAQHTIVLKNGDQIKGILLGIEADEVTYAVNRIMKKVHLKEVSSIFFNEYVPYDGSFVESEPIRSVKSGNYVIKYIIKDREMITPPKISIGTEDKGTVVVDIWVNKRGIVTRAEPGAVGTTTSSEYLYTKAKFAAQGAVFNEHPLGPIETKGQIIITY